jgi:hypothetical protein
MGEYPSFRYCFFSPRSFASFQPIEQKTKKITDQCKKILEPFFSIYIRLSKYSKYCGIQIKQTKRLKTEKVKMTKIDGLTGAFLVPYHGTSVCRFN